MNITYIIGNGFDINLGLKTGYADFYKWYVDRDREMTPEVVRTFRSEINDFIKENRKKEDDTIDWSDMELALGQYTEKVPREQFETLLLDIEDSLKAYLRIEYNNRFHKESYDVEKFKLQMEYPITDHFVVARRRTIQAFMERLTSGVQIRIISFNYTPTIEDLLGFEEKQTWEGKKGQKVELKAIKHIHHSLTDENILVGVNDEQQIANELYHDDSNVCDIFLKPSANRILGSYVDWECQNIIEETDIFVLYGTSVGETDRVWWNMIAKRLLQSENTARMIWFVHDPKRMAHANLLYKNVGREVIPYFGKVAGIPNISLDNLEKRIFVTLSNKMFSFPS